MGSGRAARPRLEILAAALLFSTGGAAIKACSLSAWQVAGLRSGIAAVFLWIALRPARRHWNGSTLLVGAAYAVTLLLYVGGNKLTTAANTIFLQSTAPLYVLALSAWLLGERPRRADLVFGFSLAVGMTMFFLGIEAPQVTAPDPVRGNLLGALAGFSWAMTLIGLRWLGRGPTSGSGNAAAAVVAGNLLVLLVSAPMGLPIHGARPLDWVLLVYLGAFQIGLAYVFMTRGVGRVPALEVSLLLLLEPVLNVIWAWLLHGERPGAWSSVGCAVILVATLGRTATSRRV